MDGALSGVYLPSLGTTPHYSRGHDSGVASWMAFRDASHSSLGPMSRAAAVSLFTPNGRDITPEQSADVSGGLRGIRAAARRLREGNFAQYRSRTHQRGDSSGRLVQRTEPFGTATAGVRRLFLNREAAVHEYRCREGPRQQQGVTTTTPANPEQSEKQPTGSPAVACDKCLVPDQLLSPE